MRPTVKFGFQLFAAAAGSGAVRASGLSHKAVNNPVKFQTVVKAGANQLFNPGHMVRCNFRIHLYDDFAVFEFKQQSVFGIFNLI